MGQCTCNKYRDLTGSLQIAISQCKYKFHGFNRVPKLALGQGRVIKYVDLTGRLK